MTIMIKDQYNRKAQFNCKIKNQNPPKIKTPRSRINNIKDKWSVKKFAQKI